MSVNILIDKIENMTADVSTLDYGIHINADRSNGEIALFSLYFAPNDKGRAQALVICDAINAANNETDND